MTEKRNQRAQIHVLKASISDVRARLESAGFKAWVEHVFEDGSVDFRFTKMTDLELMQLVRTVPREAYAKRAVSAASVAHLSPDELKRLMLKKSDGENS